MAEKCPHWESPKQTPSTEVFQCGQLPVTTPKHCKVQGLESSIKGCPKVGLEHDNMGGVRLERPWPRLTAPA